MKNDVFVCPSLYLSINLCMYNIPSTTKDQEIGDFYEKFSIYFNIV